MNKAKSLKQYANGIKDGGYATDPYYVVQLVKVIHEYGLAQYDTGIF